MTMDPVDPQGRNVLVWGDDRSDEPWILRILEVGRNVSVYGGSRIGWTRGSAGSSGAKCVGFRYR